MLLSYRSIDKVKLKALLIGFFGILISIGGWYTYARHYNNINNSGFFLQSVFPIWETTKEERKYIFDCLYFSLVPSFFNRVAFGTILMLFISILVFYRKVNRFLLFVSIFCFIGVVTYFFLFFKAFDVHDYYLTNLLIFIPLIVLTFCEFLNRNYPRIFHNTRFKIGLSLILVFLTYQTALKNRLKYDSRKYFGSNLIIKKSDRESAEYYHWSYENNFKAFETVRPYLRSMGILRTDKVICLSDESINISLYLMDQKGYTKYGFGGFSDNKRVEFAKGIGCKYLIITNDQLSITKDIESFLTHKVGQYQNINIYSLENNLRDTVSNLVH